MTETTTTPPDADATAPVPDGARPRRRPATMTLVAAVLLVVALVCAVFFGVRWARAGGGEGSVAQARDTALDDARQAAINLTTVDSGDVAGTLSNWDSVVTGDLATQFASSRSQLEQQITANPGTTSVTIVNAALSTLDASAGTATAVIFADVTTTAKGGKPVPQRFALSMSVQRTDTGWKASALQSLAQGGTGK
jgi:Mce-associated membrane protein